MGVVIAEIILAVATGALVGWLVAFLRGRQERLQAQFTPVRDASPLQEVAGPTWRLEPGSSLSSAPNISRDLRLLIELLDAIGDGALVLDAEQTVLASNTLAGSLMDMLPCEMVGRKLWELVQYRPLLDALDHVRLGAILTAEVPLHHPRERILRVHALAPHGSIGGTSESSRHSPLARHGATAVTLPADFSPLQASQMTIVILRDVTALRQLDRYRREFLGNVSHELKTPLAAIQAAAETLQAGALHDPQSATRFLHHILDNTHRLSRLVQDMLQLARIEAGQQTWRKQAVDVVDVVHQVVERHQARAAQKGLPLRIEVSGAPILAWVDADALTRILENLLDNAIKYTHQGNITIRCYPTERQVVIEVADTGPGIEPEHLPRIFERFYRADKARSQDGGSGLGLAIVKHLVQAMDGSIEVNSQPGVGSRFNVRLPIATSDS